MTSAAQQALRRIIELHTSTTRFVMACNTSTRIIEAIQSRCSIIRFSRIDDESMKKRLIDICKMENVSYTDEGLACLILTSNGDMRRAINNLQSVYITYENIIPDTVEKIIDKPNHLIIQKLLKLCFDKTFDEAHQIITKLITDGYSSLDIIQLIFLMVKDDNLDSEIKLKILSEIGNTQLCLVQGGDSYLQLMALISRIMLM